MASEPQFADGVDRRFKVRVVVDDEGEWCICRGQALQPHAHAGDDAEIRLEEERVERGSQAPLIEVPGRVAFDRTLSCAQQLAIGKDYFEACGHCVVGAVMLVGVAIVH